MDRLDLEIRGLDRRHGRRFQQARGTPGGAGALSWPAALAVGVAYLVTRSLPVVTGVLVGAPVVELNGKPVVLEEIVVLVDASDSMSGTEEILQQKLDPLSQEGVRIVRREAYGFGVSRTGKPENLLHRVQALLAERPGLDAIYAFSDFTANNPPFWDSDPEGFGELDALLAQHKTRLFLHSVRDAPDPALVALARRSKGGFLETPPGF